MARRKQVGLGWEEEGPVVGAPGPSGLLRRVRPRWPGVQGGFYYLLNESSKHPRGVATDREKKNHQTYLENGNGVHIYLCFTLFYKIKNL
jgi:hypothetical protein